MASKLELEMGIHRLVVENKQILFGKIEELADGLGKIKFEHSAFKTHPMLDGETTDEWYERIMPELLKEETARKEDESVDDFVKRIHTPKLDTHENVKNTLELIAKTFAQPEKVTDESFSQTSFPNALEFIVELFKKCKLSTRGYE